MCALPLLFDRHLRAELCVEHRLRRRVRLRSAEPHLRRDRLRRGERGRLRLRRSINEPACFPGSSSRPRSPSAGASSCADLTPRGLRSFEQSTSLRSRRSYILVPRWGKRSAGLSRRRADASTCRSARAWSRVAPTTCPSLSPRATRRLRDITPRSRRRFGRARRRSRQPQRRPRQRRSQQDRDGDLRATRFASARPRSAWRASSRTAVRPCRRGHEPQHGRQERSARLDPVRLRRVRDGGPAARPRSSAVVERGRVDLRWLHGSPTDRSEVGGTSPRPNHRRRARAPALPRAGWHVGGLRGAPRGLGHPRRGEGHAPRSHARPNGDQAFHARSRRSPVASPIRASCVASTSVRR